MREAILTINAGSSTIKFAIFAVGKEKDALDVLYRGQIDEGGRQARFTVQNMEGFWRALEGLSYCIKLI